MPKPFRRTSVTIDEAVAILLGLASGPVEYRRMGGDDVDDDDDDDCPIFDIRETLTDELDALAGAHAEAKFDKQPEPVIAEKYAALQEHKAIVDRAERYLCAIDDELSKGERSTLRIDAKRSNDLHTYITRTSLEEWIKAKPRCLDASLAGVIANNGAPTSLGVASNPWEVIDAHDPPPAQPWYTAARYFARELVRGDSTLRTKRSVLAQKVVQSFRRVGIFKRGGKDYHDPGTILKALSNVKF